jgi:hypothetical protein
MSVTASGSDDRHFPEAPHHFLNVILNAGHSGRAV